MRARASVAVVIAADAFDLPPSVIRVDSRGPRVLAQGVDVRPGSLTLTNTLLAWRESDRVRTSRLR
jgi:hypothetical protein